VSPRAALRLATRRSVQASTQAQTVAEAISTATGRHTELVFVETGGDRDQTAPLHEIGGLGVFVKEVQQAVLEGRADLAVHSAKDLPSQSTPGLTIGAFCVRRDPADALVGASLTDLAPGATVATGSVRRRAQLAAVRPDLEFVELRGNIGRRLEQTPPGGSIVMAVAALQVLGLVDLVAERLDPATFVPAAGQGCVAVECRTGDVGAEEVVRAVDDLGTRRAVTVERAVLAELGSGCSLPVGAHADGATLFVFLAAEEVLASGMTPTTYVESMPMSGGRGDVDAARAIAARAKAALGR
jgi:hydroxymethylbilane synthase